MELLELERHVDTTIMRKRLEVQEALKRQAKVAINQNEEKTSVILSPFVWIGSLFWDVSKHCRYMLG